LTFLCIIQVYIAVISVYMCWFFFATLWVFNTTFKKMSVASSWFLMEEIESWSQEKKKTNKQTKSCWKSPTNLDKVCTSTSPYLCVEIELKTLKKTMFLVANSHLSSRLRTAIITMKYNLAFFNYYIIVVTFTWWWYVNPFSSCIWHNKLLLPFLT